MRITTDQAEITKKTVDRILGTPNQVWLFGSRVDDNLHGGDIDLFVETQANITNRAGTICRLYGALMLSLGDRKIDILLKDARTVEAPIFGIARREGVLL
ncbi:nucleotidyltransferase domain-containing protein [Methylotenera sp.]|uniref:nucleotidyltransferase domain-containing protein n=1 Tax=Methylotenera sp. TaxID=2051956 RepID=UPI002730708B|nr:nucleotidyltransferase domain-containing protein [Methylotenera sp.]MDP2230731.1 nucleotidyltransferase domain-containing protein [Methylotenera sp.]